MKAIRSKEDLRALIGPPAPTTPLKIHGRLNATASAFIRKSPLLFLSTADANGRSMVSPKGDAPGFVRIADHKTLLIPERKGNRLLLSLQNLLENDQIGLLFLIPGTAETLRVHGKAALLADDDLCHRFISRGRPALLVLRIAVEECFFHCGKALLRAGVWNPSGWPAGVPVSFGKEIAENLRPDDVEAFVNDLDAGVRERYRTDL